MERREVDQATKAVECFVAAINSHNAKKLSEWMTDGHILTDARGMQVIGRKSASTAWGEYFEMFPNYQMTCDTILAQGSIVAVFGSAEATFARGGELRGEDHWRLPAAWMAVIRDGRTARWNVYCDSEPVHKIIFGGK